MTIGELANQAGVGVETVRFYERRGLITEPPRRASGYRQYAFDDVQRVRFIRRAKALGFSLVEISELLRLNDHPVESREEVLHRVQDKMADIKARIKDLQRMQRALGALEDACTHAPHGAACPILEAFADPKSAGR